MDRLIWRVWNGPGVNGYRCEVEATTLVGAEDAAHHQYDKDYAAVKVEMEKNTKQTAPIPLQQPWAPLKIELVAVVRE